MHATFVVAQHMSSLAIKKIKKLKKKYIYILLIIPLTELAEVHCGHGLLVYLISTSTLPD